MPGVDDIRYMREALRLAERGLYTTTPNPRVGCVLVRDGIIVGRGWHERAGEPHAEVHALREAGDRAHGATAYVTLEPCAHHGRTPPCADALLAACVARVVAAIQDPNPLVAGQGLARLAAAGVAVESGVCAEEAARLNIGFLTRMQRGRPWVRTKIAASLDGRTALANGRSQWITGPEARADGHAWRARACAILTGAGTVLKDDPQLTVRDVSTPRQPLRVVVDGKLAVPPTARILGGNTVVVTASTDATLVDRVRATGTEVVLLPGHAGRVDLPALMKWLGQRAINEVHVEAGAGLNGALLTAGLVDELLIYMAPAVLGQTARGMFDLRLLEDLAQSVRCVWQDVQRVGPDLRLSADVIHSNS